MNNFYPDPNSRGDWAVWKHRLPILVVPVVLIIAAYVLHNELHAIRLADLKTELGVLSSGQILLALMFTTLSYACLTNYDRLALAYLGVKLPLSEIGMISFAATAVGHNIGVAAISAGSIRFRAYSAHGIAALDIGKIIAFCSATFAVGGSLLLGLALTMESASQFGSLSFPVWVLRAIGLLLVASTLFYLVSTRFLKNEITLRNWRFKLPIFGIALQQVFFASLDLLAAATTLFVLLPADANLSYHVVLGAYLIAIFLGVISSVPGGVGVFEGLMLLLLPEIPAVQLLAAILAYRMCYYLLPLAVAIVLLAIREISAPVTTMASALKGSGRWINLIAPQIAALVVLLVGILLVISGSLPGIESRLHFLSSIIPLALLETSHLINSAVGIALIIVARGLFLRLRVALYIAFFLLAAGAIVSLGKGLDFEEASTVLLAGLILWICRREFYRESGFMDEGFPIPWMMTLVLVLAAALWIGVFANKNVEYRDALWWQFAVDADASRMMRGLVTSAVVVIGFGLFQLLRVRPPAVLKATTAELDQVRTILANSNSTEANVALLGDKRFLLHASGEAFIMYQVSGNSWIALGDPVGAEEYFKELAWDFKTLAHRHSDRCVFYEVSDAHLNLYVDLGLSLSKIGEEARVSLAEFSLDGSRRAELRQVRNRAGRDGATFEVVAADKVAACVAELKQVSDYWLNAKGGAEKGFSLGKFSPEYIQNFDVAVVRSEGKIVAFANLWKSGDAKSLSVDLMRHGEGAPKSVMDFLFVEIFLWGKENNYSHFDLGMAPLAGLESHTLSTLWHKIGNTIFRLGEDFYNFEGLRQYKQKFDPEWTSVYLAAPGGTALPRVLIDATLLISGGAKRVFTNK